MDLLLFNGADHNAAGGDYGSALNHACLSGNVRLIQLLLDREAQSSTRVGWYTHSLCEAIIGGKVGVVQFLLEQGTDVNLRGGRWGSALQAACSTFRSDTCLVRQLLDIGADVNVRGGKFGNALCAAVYNRHVESVQMLLDWEALIDMRGGKYGNALQIAIKKGLGDARKALLKRGWKIMIQKRPFWRRRCALSDWHPSIQRERSLHPVDSEFCTTRRNSCSSSDVSSDRSWLSASSGTSRTPSLDRRCHRRERYFTCTSSIRSSSGSSSDRWASDSSSDSNITERPKDD